MKLSTPVTDLECKVRISYKDKILLIGSCFSENIGHELANLGFDVCVNPFGTLYNPQSILNAIERMAFGEPFTQEECTFIGAGSEKICSFSHHTSFSRESVDDFLKNANESLKKAAEFYKDCNKVMITLGTSWCFRHIASGKIVSNCLKHPAKEFSRERLSVAEVSEILKRIITFENEGFQKKEFIFTVSPIRHFKDGAHGNQISKSTLLLGIEDILSLPGTDYFPSYEIMMDELRDYRFYAEDMCHPTTQAIGYIKERFLNWALKEDERPMLEENIRRLKASQHISR